VRDDDDDDDREDDERDNIGDVGDDGDDSVRDDDDDEDSNDGDDEDIPIPWNARWIPINEMDMSDERMKYACKQSIFAEKLFGTAATEARNWTEFKNNIDMYTATSLKTCLWLRVIKFQINSGM